MENQLPSNNEKVIYQDSSILISEAQLKFKGEIFTTISIVNSEIKVAKSNQTIPWVLIVLGVIALFISFGTSNIKSLDVGYFFGYPLISFGLTWLLWFVKKQYVLVIVTQKEKIDTVISKDKAYINLLVGTRSAFKQC